ncbi:MAG TPA: beta-ketoacyl synthase N-terminal-like domain-containing protein [Thermoanaerobaculia bacterium]|nr:beta-ketoacyl synthase N-terminal-like domain-containing protein [Thermoanaerobaculia bacterium]
MKPPATLVELLARRAQAEGDRQAFVYLPDGERVGSTLSYAELEGEARRVAAALAPRGVAGQRVLVCFPPGLEYVSAFFGCLHAGAVPVPAYPPEPARLQRTLPRLLAMLGNAGASVVLTPSALGETVSELLGRQAEAAGAQVVTPEGGPARAGEGMEQAPVKGEDLAFLMYTSGSTGHPKGAMVSHRSVLHNLERFPGFASRPPSAFVSWLPFFHDLGLMFGMLHPLYRGVPGILMPPLAFVERPLRWLQAISRFRATTTGGPNFGYELCVRRSNAEERRELDLSCWNLALNGSEPVRSETLARFSEAFTPHGFSAETFYPSYGLAEAAATVTGGFERCAPMVKGFDRRQLERGRVEAGNPGGRATVTLVGCGRTIEDQELVIVDPGTLRPCPPGRIGEIWVRGPSIADGFWRRPEESSELIGARLDGRGPFLRTGDLGFLEGEELFIAGRLKDVIIVRGVNHYPEDLEHTVERAHRALRAGCGAAFSVDLEGEERLVVVQEADPGAMAEGTEVLAAIRQALAEEHELEAHAIVLLPPGSIPKTSSGKIRRREARQQWQQGQLTPLVEQRAGAGARAPEPAPSTAAASGEAIRQWLLDWFAARLGAAPQAIDAQAPFARHGLASLETVQLIRELGDWLGCDLPPTLGWEHPSIEGLVQHLTAGPATDAWPRGRWAQAAPLPAQPVAIVGLSCRFPQADGPEQLWELLAGGVDAVREIPPERWDVDSYYDPDPAAPGKMSTRWGGFLPGLDRFDAAFFGISPREAVHLDPQQRLLLEIGWEALEDAGIPAESLKGSRTGVFVAKLRTDYGAILFENFASRVEVYTGSGNGDAILANRLSYFFDLKGPSVSVDTACSGSLVAIHLACQSLARGECALALAGGVNTILKPDGSLFFTKAGALAPDGRCKPFDHRADGIVRSEGAGLVVLKPLERALADGDRIHAVIRGSAVNQDGRSNGIMAPNGAAQEEVLRQAYQAAGISPAQVQYVEAHGTGTSLGDPVEVKALASVLSPGRMSGRRFRLGSLKSNLGHMESAAGIGGVIKVALAMRHRRLPPSLHFERPNPLIPFEEIPAQVQTELGPWPDESQALVAGVSGFGYGGTNAHVVLEEPPAQPLREGGRVEQPVLLPLSAQGPEALRALAAAWQRRLESEQTAGSLADLTYTASVRRGHLDHRLALVARDRQELCQGLGAFVDGQPAAGLEVGSRPPNGEPRLVLVFSGQGSQWPGMAHGLSARFGVFRATLQECDRLFRCHGEVELLTELERDAADSRLHRTELMQPAIFALQVALAALWRSWGLKPAAVVGQSLGEIAAAHVAGALSLEDAVRVVCQRSRLMARTAGRGRTAVVALPAAEASLAITGFEGELGLAGSLSPGTSVLSGAPAALEQVLAALGRQGVFCRLVRDVDVAFHSPQMEPLVDELVESLAGILPRSASLPIVSAVEGALVEGTELDAAYWGRNLRRPFLFADAVGRLARDGYEVFLEVSPHAVVEGALRQCLEAAGRKAAVVASMRRGEEPPASLLTALSQLYCQGLGIDWRAVYRGAEGRLSDVPHYPWQRQRFWYDQLGAPTRGDGMLGASASSRPRSHPLLGSYREVALPAGAHLWENRLEAGSPSFLADHRVGNVVVLPAAAYLEMALAAAEQALGPGPVAVEGASFRQALFLPPEGARTVQLTLAPEASDRAAWRVFSRSAAEGLVGEPWRLHAAGTIACLRAPVAGNGHVEVGLDERRMQCPYRLSTVDHYERMRSRGLGYGGSFQVLADLWAGPDRALGRARLPAALESTARSFRLHPVLLDGALQVVAAALAARIGAPAGEGQEGGLFLPVGVDRLTLMGPSASELWVSVQAAQRPGRQDGEAGADLALFDPAGRLVARIEGLSLRRLDGAARDGDLDLRSAHYELSWQPAPQHLLGAAPPREAGCWLVLGGADGLGDEVAEVLTQRGERSVRVEGGSRWECSSEGDRVQLDPLKAEDYHRLLSAVSHADGPPLVGIVDLWARDSDTCENRSAEDLAVAVERSCHRLVLLLQALAQMEWDQLYTGLAAGHRRALPRLWMVTAGAQPASGEEQGLALAQAPLWGFGRTVREEHPEIWGGLVDLDPQATSAQAAHELVGRLLAGDGEDEVALRGGQTLVPRLVPASREVAGPSSPRLRADGAYLLTGGLGGLGLALAQWLIERGARRLVLLQRTALPPRERWGEGPNDARIAAVCRLEALGASIHVAAVDVTDRRALADFLESYRREQWPPIRGVAHLAGRLEDRLLQRMDSESLVASLRPKVLGAALLDELLAPEELDFFLLFSSIASVLGSLGQANYAAGNAFLDALAWSRRRAGTLVQSINWGPWAGAGMAGERALQAAFESRGIHAFEPDQGLALLETLWASPRAQAVAVAVDWRRFTQSLPRGVPPPLLSLLAWLPEGAAVGASEGEGEPSWRRELASLGDASGRTAVATERVKDLVAGVLRIHPSQLDPQQPLNALGVDSLMLAEIRSRVGAAAGVEISLADLFGGASVATVARQIVAEVESDATNGSPTRFARPVDASTPLRAAGPSRSGKEVTTHAL